MYSKIEREGKHHHWFDSDNNNDKQKLILRRGKQNYRGFIMSNTKDLHENHDDRNKNHKNFCALNSSF